MPYIQFNNRRNGCNWLHRFKTQTVAGMAFQPDRFGNWEACTGVVRGSLCALPVIRMSKSNLAKERDSEAQEEERQEEAAEAKMREEDRIVSAHRPFRCRMTSVTKSLFKEHNLADASLNEFPDRAAKLKRGSAPRKSPTAQLNI